MALGTWRKFNDVVFVTKGFEFEVHFKGNLHPWCQEIRKKLFEKQRALAGET